MPATNFLFDTRELKFVIKEWLDSSKLLSCEVYKDYYAVDDIDAFIDVAYKIARDVLAPANGDADTLGVKFQDGQVKIPESIKNAFLTVCDAGMGPSQFNFEEEGHTPRIFSACQNEILTSASACMILYWIIAGEGAEVIQKFGSEELKIKVLPNMFSGKWGGTMNLTEPGAGSDLAATLTKAYPTDTPGLYKIKGTKCFISSGDGDLWENIIHLVLARIEGAREGTAGISLFVVPKNRFDNNGNITEWNDVTTVGIEHKMGIHGSPTCTISYGENNDCYGWLVGDPPGSDGKASGLAQMFVMMNESRLVTGLMSLAVAEQAYYNAREYAKIRIQGKKFTDPKGPRVPIIEHEDVKRMLLHQKACNEAMRAMLYKTYWYVDVSLSSSDAEEREWADDMFMINNPLVKAYISEMVWSLCGEALQCYGGYGFMEEYPVAQLARDSKIYSIWEGTTFIQSMDLLGRKLTMKKGIPFKKWLTEIDNFIKTYSENKIFAEEVQMLREAYDVFSDILNMLRGKMKEGHVSYQPLWANRIMFAMSLLYCGMLILDQGILAQQKLDELSNDHYDVPFYEGKIASARFYLLNEVPNIFSIHRTCRYADSSALDINQRHLG